MRPAEVWGCSRNPASDKSAITLRMVAALRPSRLARESVRDPTGSPVAINVSTTAVRISFSRSPAGPVGIMMLNATPAICYSCWYSTRPLSTLTTTSNYFRCNYLDNDSRRPCSDDRKLSELLSSSHAPGRWYLLRQQSILLARDSKQVSE